MKQLFVLLLCCLGASTYAAPTSTLASLNAVATGDFCQSSTKVPIYGFDIAVTGTTTNPNLTAVAFTTTGTYTTTISTNSSCGAALPTALLPLYRSALT